MTFWGVDHTMVHKYDTQRAVGLLRHYQANLTNPEEQALKTSVGKVSSILGSQLFHALLDIQECYEVTLQLNTEQTVVKEDSRQDAWEKGYSSQHKVSLPGSLALLHGENVSVTHGGFDSNLEIECQEGGITWVDRRRRN